MGACGDWRLKRLERSATQLKQFHSVILPRGNVFSPSGCFAHEFEFAALIHKLLYPVASPLLVVLYRTEQGEKANRYNSSVPQKISKEYSILLSLH